jgi:hypothetical protein
MTTTTDANGLYTFRVPLTDMTNPTSVYRYRVMVTQDESVLGGVYKWTDLAEEHTEDYDSDVVASSDYINSSSSKIATLDSSAYTSVSTNEVELTGKYSALDPDQRTNNDEGEDSPIGGVVGMLTDEYRDSISSEFNIYTASTSVSSAQKARARAATATVLNFRYRQDDLTQDAGIVLKKKIEDPEKPTTPPRDDYSDSDGGDIGVTPKEPTKPNILMVEPKPKDLTLPQTGGTLAAYAVITLAAVSAVGFLLTSGRRGGKKRDKKRGRKQ